MDEEDASPIGGDGAAEENVGFVTDEFRRESENDGFSRLVEGGAVGCVGLRDVDAFEVVARPSFQTDIAPDAGSDQTRAPVPAELTLLLANRRRAPERIVDFAWIEIGAVGAEIAHRAVEADDEFVFPAAKQRFHGPTPRDEHVLRAGDFATVQRNGGDRIEAVRDEFDYFLGEQ